MLKKLFSSVLAVAMVLGTPSWRSHAENADEELIQNVSTADNTQDIVANESEPQTEQTTETEVPKSEKTTTKQSLFQKSKVLIEKARNELNAFKNYLIDGYKQKSWKEICFFLPIYSFSIVYLIIKGKSLFNMYNLVHCDTPSAEGRVNCIIDNYELFLQFLKLSHIGTVIVFILSDLLVSAIVKILFK